MKPQSTLDKWFMRTKDGILIIGFLGTAFLFMHKYYSIPEEVSANQDEIKKIKVMVYQDKKALEISQLQVADLRGAIQEIKNDNKSFSEKFDRTQEENQRVFRQILAAVKS